MRGRCFNAPFFFLALSGPAVKAADRNGRCYKIVFIDKARYADFIIEHDLGVSVAATCQVKRIDSNFFADG